jgi:hypothetical protein
MYNGLCVKYPLFLTEYQISWKSIQWDLSCSMQTDDTQMDRHELWHRTWLFTFSGIWCSISGHIRVVPAVLEGTIVLYISGSTEPVSHCCHIPAAPPCITTHVWNWTLQLTQLTDLRSNFRMEFMNDGICVSRVKNPQFWAHWAVIKAHMGSEVKISTQGVLRFCKLKMSFIALYTQ